MVPNDPVRLARVMDQLPLVLKEGAALLREGGFPGESSRNRAQLLINESAGKQLRAMAEDRSGEFIGAAPKYGSTLLQSIPSGLLCQSRSMPGHDLAG